MPLSITFDDSAFRKLVKKAGPAARSAALRAGAQSIAEDGTRAFREPALRPSEWADYSQSKAGQKYKAQKMKKGRTQMLIDEGFLAKSIRVASVDSKRAEIVSDREYAAYHQFGTKKMPARPFLPFAGVNSEAGDIMLTKQGESRAIAAMTASLKKSLAPDAK